MGTTFIPLAASGIVAPVLLVEVLTKSGTLHTWSEHQASWPSVIEGGSSFFYLPYLKGSQSFRITGTTETDTATITVQNISGNTVERDISNAFTEDEFIGALVYCRIWRGDAEVALFSFMGNVINIDLDETQMSLNIEGFGNWSAISAPAYNIDVSCPLFFGSIACGSTNPTPCDHTYGNCTSIERFMGAVIQWDTTTPDVQIVQPPPAVFTNVGRPF